MSTPGQSGAEEALICTMRLRRAAPDLGALSDFLRFRIRGGAA